MSEVINKEVIVENVKRKALYAGEVAIGAAMHQMADEGAVTFATGIGVIQGLKRKSFSNGLKAGLVTYGVLGGVNAVYNVARRWDEISKA